MFASLGRALALLFDPALFGVALKAVLLTLLLFAILAVGAEAALHALPTLGTPWVNRLLAILTPVLLILGLFLLGAPVAALFATFYLDDVAKAIEARSYPADPPGKGTSLSTGLWAGVRLAGLVIVVDALLLPTEALLPGIAELATIVVNGFLLGREYFELAALRHLSLNAADALRRRNAGGVFAGGLVISILTVVPVANLFAPLFGAAMMVHLTKRAMRNQESVR